MKFWRDILTVARHELSDSIRSRKAVVMLILYVAGSLLVCNGIVSGIHRAEAEISRTLGLAPSATTGTVIDNLWKSHHFQRIVRDMIGDRELAEQLISVHPMAIVYGLLAFAFTPVLVILLASPRISEELNSGSIRFALMRTSKWSWCLGKYLGQGFMTILALTLSAIATWCLLRFRIMGMDSFSAAQGMMIYAWKAWLFSLGYLGLALGISQLTHSPNKAMASGFGAWILFAVLGVMSKTWTGEGWRQIWRGIHLALPSGHRMDLWRADPAHQLPAALFIFCLSLMYMAAGHIFLDRKDL